MVLKMSSLPQSATYHCLRRLHKRQCRKLCYLWLALLMLTLSSANVNAHFASVSTAKRLHSSDNLFKQKLLPLSSQSVREDVAGQEERATNKRANNTNINNSDNNNPNGNNDRNDNDDLVLPVAVPGSASSRFNVDSVGMESVGGVGGGGAIHSPTTFLGGHQPPLPLYRAYNHQRLSPTKSAALPSIGSAASRQQPVFEERSKY